MSVGRNLLRDYGDNQGIIWSHAHSFSEFIANNKYKTAPLVKQLKYILYHDFQEHINMRKYWWHNFDIYHHFYPHIIKCTKIGSTALWSGWVESAWAAWATVVCSQVVNDHPVTQVLFPLFEANFYFFYLNISPNYVYI